MDIKSLLVGFFVVLLSGCTVTETDIEMAKEYCEKVHKVELQYLDYKHLWCEGKDRIKLTTGYRVIYKHNLKNNP